MQNHACSFEDRPVKPLRNAVVFGCIVWCGDPLRPLLSEMFLKSGAEVFSPSIRPNGFDSRAKLRSAPGLEGLVELEGF